MITRQKYGTKQSLKIYSGRKHNFGELTTMIMGNAEFVRMENAAVENVAP